MTSTTKTYDAIVIGGGPGGYVAAIRLGQLKQKAVGIEATKGIILATGSRSIEIKGFKFDGKKIISAKEAVSLDHIPARMMIIGGGIIGMELGGVYGKLGTRVTVVEALDRVLATVDE